MTKYLRFRTPTILLYIFALTACSAGTPDGSEMSDQTHTDDFERLCEETASVKIVDPVLWEKYVALAHENSARIDKKPSLVAIEGFEFYFGDSKSKIRKLLPPGLHDDEIYIYNESKIVAILFNKIKISKGFSGSTSSNCTNYGLNYFILNEKQ